MSLATADLPADPDALRAFALACQAELKAAELSVQLRSLEIEKLKFQIAKLRRMQFGRPSERISRQIEQLELQLEELQTGEAEESPQPWRMIGQNQSARSRSAAIAGSSAAPGDRASA